MAESVRTATSCFFWNMGGKDGGFVGMTCSWAMFVGLKLVVLPIGGITRAQKATFEKRITSLKGTVVELPAASSFGRQLLFDVNAVVCGPASTLAEAVSALPIASAADLPPKLKVQLSQPWVVQWFTVFSCRCCHRNGSRNPLRTAAWLSQTVFFWMRRRLRLFCQPMLPNTLM